MSLGNALQENLLILLTFDDKRSQIIRGVVDPGLYGGMYRDIAVQIYDYIDRYKEAPKDHLPDLLVDKLESKNKREAKLYEDIVRTLDEMKDKVNAEYIMSQVETFVKRQSLKMVAIDLAKALQRDTDEGLEEAEELISQATSQGLKVFDAGTRLTVPEKALAFLDNDVQAFPTGLPELDKRNFGPTRTEAHLYISDTKKGKTWWLIWLARVALRNQLRVAHISLEMGEDRVAMRYMQTLFALAKRKETIRRVKFSRDKLGKLEDFEEFEVTPKLAMTDPNIRAKLEKKIGQSAKWLKNIFIKRFPTGTMTIGMLEAYLDNLEVTERFMPDLLIVDYPDIMKFDRANYRHAIDELYQSLRGVAVKRNCALAIVSQSNREGGKAKQVGRANVAEAYSKIAHVDVALTYSQSIQEKALGLARIHVAAGRNDEDEITLLLSQNYAMGQFAIDSILMANNYWTLLGQAEADAKEDEGFEDEQ